MHCNDYRYCIGCVCVCFGLLGVWLVRSYNQTAHTQHTHNLSQKKNTHGTNTQASGAIAAVIYSNEEARTPWLATEADDKQAMDVRTVPSF